MNTPFVSILICTYKRPAALERCLKSVLTQTYPQAPVEILVFNDGGADESSGLAATLFKEHEGDGYKTLRVVSNEGANMQIAAARRFIAAKASPDSNYFLFVDDDAVLTPGCLSELLQSAMADPKIGALGPRIAQLENPAQTVHAAGFVNRWTGRYSEIKSDRAIACDWLNSTCLLVSREAHDTIGGFWGGFHTAHEEVDFGLRLKNAGFSVFYQPSAQALHEIEMGAPKRERLYYLYRNKALVIRRGFHGLARILALAQYLCLGLPLYLMESIHRRGLNFVELRTILQAVLDGLLGRSGPRMGLNG